MSCASGLDPFGERGEALARHARDCPGCADVLRVLDACRVVWRDEAVCDEARAVFRERRLGRSKRPARMAMASAVLFVAIGAATAWAFERFAEPVHEAVPTVTVPSVSLVPHGASAAVPSPGPSVDEASIAVEPAASVAPSATAARSPHAENLGAAELWELGLARLDRGDREGAERMFRRVIDAPAADPRLRSRAMFRWAQLRLAAGDTVTPRDTLWRLVRDRDTTLGFDAALLLERCSHGERARIWDAYLESQPGEPLRTQAIQRRNGVVP
jgi:hypothetical protein